MWKPLLSLIAAGVVVLALTPTGPAQVAQPAQANLATQTAPWPEGVELLARGPLHEAYPSR